MVLAEQVGEPVCLVGEGLEPGRPRFAQQPQLVPEVLDPLAPIVDGIGGGLLANGAEPVTPAHVGARASDAAHVGALALAGSGHGWISTVLGFLAIVFAMMNVVGGYAVTNRMLQMFRKEK